MVIQKLFTIAALGLMVACSSPETLYTAPQPEVTERVKSRYSSIEVLEVSLPTYAAGEEVLVASSGGALVTGDTLWADDPTRAVTLSLTRALTEITGARIAPAPWPFDAFPGARVDVRVERFLSEGGALHLSGQYFVADLSGNGRDRARLFDLTAPLPPEATLSDLLTARSALIADLAVMIARNGL